MLSEVRFGSFLTYSPKGRSETSIRSRHICHQIKADGPGPVDGERMIEYAVRRLADEATPELRDILRADAVLVPCPSSALFKPGPLRPLWVAFRICLAMRERGLGARVNAVLTRTEPVPKSAWAPAGQRPTPARHHASMSAEPSLEAPAHIVLVDDVVTKGATLLGAAARLKDSFPASTITAFAMVRTLGLVPEIAQIVDPCVGRIRLDAAGQGDRQP